MVLFLAVIYMTYSFTASVDVVLLLFLDTLQHCNRMSPLKSPSSTGALGVMLVLISTITFKYCISFTPTPALFFYFTHFLWIKLHPWTGEKWSLYVHYNSIHLKLFQVCYPHNYRIDFTADNAMHQTSKKVIVFLVWWIFCPVTLIFMIFVHLNASCCCLIRCWTNCEIAGATQVCGWS